MNIPKCAIDVEWCWSTHALRYMLDTLQLPSPSQCGHYRNLWLCGVWIHWWVKLKEVHPEIGWHTPAKREPSSCLARGLHMSQQFNTFGTHPQKGRKDTYKIVQVPIHVLGSSSLSSPLSWQVFDYGHDCPQHNMTRLGQPGREFKWIRYVQTKSTTVQW